MSWLRSLRSSASDRDRILAGAASIAITIALAKVFSPQYLLWLVPFVVAIPGKKRIPIALLVGACALTAWVFPNHWLALLSLHWTPLIVELLREVLVLTSAGFLAAAVRPLRGPRDVEASPDSTSTTSRRKTLRR